MKKTKRMIISLLLLAVLLAAVLTVLCACSEGGDMDGGGGMSVYIGSDTYSKKMASDAMYDTMEASEGESAAPSKSADDAVKDERQDKGIAPGQITAAAWNDNQYYSYWKTMFVKGQTEAENGKFVSLASDWGFNTQKRVTVTLKNGENPVTDTAVTLADDEGTVVFTARTDANGVANLFTTLETGKVSCGDVSENFTAESRDITLNLETSAEKKDIIQLMFIVDVTGSMGDEISYLQAELGDVIKQVAEAQTSAKIYLSFLFYRDVDDGKDYLNYFDFRDVTATANYASMQSILSEQGASGGGDYEEAVDEALELASQKQWVDGATKLIFHVLDAPAHSGSKYETRFAKAVNALAAEGVRVCPVLASGADEICEYTMRTAAIVTGGTSIFITDDSGIGGEHLDPDLPNITVEYLNALLVRIINGYHKGTFADPVWYNATGKQQ